MIVCKGRSELQAMREANLVVARVLSKMEEMIAPGVQTKELDRVAEELILESGGRPSFKGYRGFPASICVSVNDEIVHGIPGKRTLKEGDIVSVDVGVHLKGFHGDSARTFAVGEISPDLNRLLKVTRESLFQGIDQARAGNRVSDISSAVQRHVEKAGYSVVREFVGHGIGRSLHEDPQVPNFGRPGRGPRLRPGMVLAIEPMVNTRGPEVKVLSDRWTAVTVDGGCSAHFEHSVAITENGPWILSDPQASERGEAS
ncbi:MAG TPA: type I methionyl aminopeptidase [Acidobacteriota bacterium]|nr:type I methionyl aminopeptidase [Acidobacteriota bacterium]